MKFRRVTFYLNNKSMPITYDTDLSKDNLINMIRSTKKNSGLFEVDNGLYVNLNYVSKLKIEEMRK